MIAVMLIALGGAVGSVLRWLVSHRDDDLPLGMMTANVAASALAARLAELEGQVDWLVNIGLLGALSTWSSLAVATAGLAAKGRPATAAAVLTGTTVSSIAAAWVML